MIVFAVNDDMAIPEARTAKLDISPYPALVDCLMTLGIFKTTDIAW